MKAAKVMIQNEFEHLQGARADVFDTGSMIDVRARIPAGAAAPGS
jgi:hypothetical protein